jgi:hypothetical protein
VGDGRRWAVLNLDRSSVLKEWAVCVWVESGELFFLSTQCYIFFLAKVCYFRSYFQHVALGMLTLVFLNFMDFSDLDDS